MQSLWGHPVLLEVFLQVSWFLEEEIDTQIFEGRLLKISTPLQNVLV